MDKRFLINIGMDGRCDFRLELHVFVVLAVKTLSTRLLDDLAGAVVIKDRRIHEAHGKRI